MKRLCQLTNLDILQASSLFSSLRSCKLLAITSPRLPPMIADTRTFLSTATQFVVEGISDILALPYSLLTLSRNREDYGYGCIYFPG